MIRHRYVLAVLALAGFGVLSCSEPQGVTSPAAHRAYEGDLLPWLGTGLSLLRCNPVPYDSVVQTVGPAGGIIYAGPHALAIPAGALDTNTTITAVVPSDTLDVIRFQPEGLTFARPAALTMSYASCPLAGLVGPK